jgi:polyferredoxin
MLVMGGLFFYLIASVQPMGLDVLRDRSQLFRINNEGLVENTYTLKILNKTQQDTTYSLSVEGLEDIEWYGAQTVNVSAGEIYTLPISLGVDPYVMKAPIVDITFILHKGAGDNETTLHTESRFIGELR